MAENPFRILLDFRELNFKFYKFVWMSISPREILTIKDLKDALLKKFSFERTDLLLFLRDGLLPEDENISNILRENDSVRLFYAEPSNVNANDSRTVSNEQDEESPNNNQEKSSKKRKEPSDISEDDNEQIESSKKRKHSFSNGTYLFKNNSTPENSFISAVSDGIENVTSADLSNFENSNHSKSCKIKKKLKYTHDVSQNSFISGNEIALSSDIISMSEKNQSKVNSCKKKKKHKHSKDVSESELIFLDDIVTMSEINENKSRSHKKKKKHKHSRDASKIVSESAVSFYDETFDPAKKLNNSANDLKTGNELTELQESIFHTVTEDPEVLTVAPNSFGASSVNTSSGIGHSLKTSQESNKKISSEPSCSEAHVSCSKSIQEIEENNVYVSQGNNCKKKKRKRHRKRKSLLISPQVDALNDYNLDMTSPQKSENSTSHFTLPSYQSPGISPRNKETLDNSISNAFFSKRNTICLETKSNFMEPFGSCISNTSTPFSQTRAVSSASPRKNAIAKIPSSSNSSEYQSVKTYTSTVLPAIQKKMVQSYLSTHSSPFSATNSRKATIPNCNFHDKSLSNKNNFEKSTYSEGVVKAVNSQTDELEIEVIEPEVKEGTIGKSENFYQDKVCSTKVVGKNQNGLPALSSACSATYKKNNATTPNHNFHDKSLSTETNSFDKSTDSFSNIGIKSRFLDPSFSYKGCPPLNSCPLVGTRIAYKVLELDSSYSPVVSNFKEGVVKAINSQTDELEIELIQPEVKEGRIGKFENLYEDELPPCEVIRKVTLSWPSLIDPVQVIY